MIKIIRLSDKKIGKKRKKNEMKKFSRFNNKHY